MTLHIIVIETRVNQKSPWWWFGLKTIRQTPHLCIVPDEADLMTREDATSKAAKELAKRGVKWDEINAWGQEWFY